MFYKEICKPRMADYNRSGKLSYEAILQILETAGSNHSDQVNDNVIVSSQNGIAWILTDWRIQFFHRPVNGDELHITTWVRGKTPASAVYRDFIVNDKDGRELLRAEAKFALFDLQTERLTRISKDLFMSYSPEEQNVFECSAPKLRTPSEFLTEKPLVLRRSDIDFNGHVHNTRYLDFALEGIPTEFYQNDDFCELRIVYRKPVKETDAVYVKYAVTEDGCIVGIYGNDTPCSLVELKYLSR